VVRWSWSSWNVCRYRGPDDTFWYHDSRYREVSRYDDDTCHDLKQICSEMITAAPTQVQNYRHRTSTSMYSLTFHVRVTTPPQHGRNGTAHAAGASSLSLARAVFAGMCSAWHCVPSSKQLRGIPYHSAKLHPGSCNSVGMRPRTDTQTHRQTDRHTHTHTHTHRNARDHNTFRVVYDSREM